MFASFMRFGTKVFRVRDFEGQRSCSSLFLGPQRRGHGIPVRCSSRLRGGQRGLVRLANRALQVSLRGCRCVARVCRTSGTFRFSCPHPIDIPLPPVSKETQMHPPGISTPAGDALSRTGLIKFTLAHFLPGNKRRCAVRGYLLLSLHIRFEFFGF